MRNIKKLEIILLLSASNLLLFNYWLKIGIFSEEIRYYFFHKPILEILLGIILLLIIFLIFLVIFFFLKKNDLIYLKNLFIFFLFIIILDGFRTASNLLPINYVLEHKFISFGIIVLFAVLFIKFINFFSSIIQFFFLFLSPFVIVIFIYLFNLLVILDWDNNQKLIKNKNYQDKKNKIILIVFDELDQRVIKNGNYKNFDKILNKSDVYSNAFPSGDATLTIIPSILTGTQLPLDTSKYNFLINEIVYDHGGQKKELSKQENLFKLINKNFVNIRKFFKIDKKNIKLEY